MMAHAVLHAPAQPGTALLARGSCTATPAGTPCSSVSARLDCRHSQPALASPSHLRHPPTHPPAGAHPPTAVLADNKGVGFDGKPYTWTADAADQNKVDVSCAALRRTRAP